MMATDKAIIELAMIACLLARSLAPGWQVYARFDCVLVASA